MCVKQKCNFYFQKFDILVISHDFGRFFASRNRIQEAKMIPIRPDLDPHHRIRILYWIWISLNSYFIDTYWYMKYNSIMIFEEEFQWGHSWLQRSCLITKFVSTFSIREREVANKKNRSDKNPPPFHIDLSGQYYYGNSLLLTWKIMYSSLMITSLRFV